MNRVSFFLGSVSLLATLVCATALSAQNPNLIISNSPTEIGEGQIEEIAINFEHAESDPVAGFHISMCHDPAVVDVLTVDFGADVAVLGGGGGPGFSQSEIFSNGWYMGVVISLFGIEVLPAGATYELSLVNYQALGVEGDSTALTDCPLGSNDLESVIVIFGQSISPTFDANLAIGPPGTIFLRGDFNEDGVVNIADSVAIGGYLFIAGPASGCLQTGDVNADGAIDIADMVTGLNFLFGGGLIAGPFPDCGFDLTSPLSCDSYAGACP